MAADKCVPALTACTNEISLYQELAKEQTNYVSQLKSQRDDAIKQVEKSPNQGLPFYYWVILGVAGGVILTRGVR